MVSQEEYAQLDGIALSGLIKRGDISASEALEAAKDRADALNPLLNAIVRRCDGLAEELASGVNVDASPLAGVPTLLKDLGARMQGVPSRSASRFVPEAAVEADNAVVIKMKAAGMIPFGVTNCSEFGLTPVCEPALYGAAQNPRAPGLSTGGSSGGSASAVAAGVVPFAHATDGGGSIRIPAASCGLVGLKPTRGRISCAPEGDWASGITVQGVLSRTVRDTAAAIDALSGYVAGDPYVAPNAPSDGFPADLRRPFRRPLRIAFDLEPHDGIALSPACATAVERAANVCEALGHHVEIGRPAMAPTGEWDPELRAAFHTVYAAAAAASIISWATSTGEEPGVSDFERLTWNYYTEALSRTAADYNLALWRLQYATREFAEFFDGVDVYLTPTMLSPPPPIGVLDARSENATVEQAAVRGMIAVCPLYNMSGQPAISLPLATTPEGVPVGVMFGTRLGGEGLLLRLAAQLEEAVPWSHPAVEWNPATADPETGEPEFAMQRKGRGQCLQV